MNHLSGKRKVIMFFVAAVLTVMQPVTAMASDSDIRLSSDDEASFLLQGMPELASEGAIVVDIKTGYTMYEKDIYKKLYPASITKIMTAILAIENLNLSDIVTFSHDAVYTIEPGSSSGYLREGEQITVEQCLYGLMLISGNDIANGLGEAISGSMSEFAVKMTEKAKKIGCMYTNFSNAHGLHDENHYTCPYDMAVIGKYAYDNYDMYRTLISETRYVVEPTEKCDETRYWHNSNRLIEVGNKYYDEDCLGGKTGFTNEAGGTLVTYHNINGRTIMIVVMKAYNSAGAYDDTIRMCDYIEENTDQTYYGRLDESYQELKKQEAESLAQAVNVVNGEKSAGISNDGDEVEKNVTTFSLPQKIVLLILTIFVLYYFYISVQRSKRRRKRSRRHYRKIYTERDL